MPRKYKVLLGSHQIKKDGKVPVTIKARDENPTFVEQRDIDWVSIDPKRFALVEDLTKPEPAPQVEQDGSSDPLQRYGTDVTVRFALPAGIGLRIMLRKNWFRVFDAHTLKQHGKAMPLTQCEEMVADLVSAHLQTPEKE